MPGRVAARAPRTSATSSTKTRSSGNTRSNAIDIPDEGVHTSLRAQICATLGEVQKSNTGQRKLVVSLRKIQEVCCYEPAQPKKRAGDEDFDEAEFNEEICRCLLRVLSIKKSEPAGDRLVKFLGLFLKHATDADNAIFAEEDPDMQIVPETPTSRLTTHIISLLLRLLPAKDKVIRFRCTQIIAHLINNLDSVDDELFHHIRLGLLKRLRDKESSVRVQAVYGLGRLAGELDADHMDEDDSDDETAGGVLDRLLDILQNDPSAEVRRSLLLNLPFTPSTLPFLLERARDLDASIRRALYARLLPALGDFRHLSLTHREKLLRWGLRDRDDNVKKATARLFRERWIEDCVRSPEVDTEAMVGQTSAPSSEGLLELLERIDVVNAGVDGGIALDAMKEFWDGRPDYCNFITFEESYWRELTPESAFVARTFNDYAQSTSSYEDKMPEVTRLAFLIQTNINTLVERVQRSAFEADAEEDSVHQEFIVDQLLHIALTLDYSDEVGRRTMFSLMREALALAELPEEATKLVTEVLRIACGTNQVSEKEFSDVVLEAVAEVHDTIMGEDQAQKPEPEVDDSFHSARSALSGESTPKNQVDAEYDEERAVKEIMVNMKCLHIAQCMLQNVEQPLGQNSALVTMLNNLVVPAVRSQEAPIRERGLLCLGLCCLLDKNLAEENLELFLLCFSKGHEALQSIAIQIIGDILSAHPTMLQNATAMNEAEQPQEHPLRKPIHKLFSKSLKSQSQVVQSMACTALAKLMLSSPPASEDAPNSILDHDELLRMLTVAYFNPELSNNSSLRQSLSYFLPVYCHSRKENSERMGRIAMSVLHWCIGVKEEMDVDADDDAINEMVGLSVVTAHLVDWTDGRRLAPVLLARVSTSNIEPSCDVHLQMAIDILEKVLGVCSKDERKLHIAMLGKLHISMHHDSDKLQAVARLAQEAVDEKVAEDAPSRTALSKLQTAIDKTQSGPSRSRAASRAPSMAPSTMDDEETVAAANDSDDGRTVRDDESVAPETPAPSPPKKGGSRAQASPRRRATQPTAPDTSVMTDITEVPTDLESLTVKEESASGDEPLVHRPSTGAARPRWRPEELQARSNVDDDSQDTLELEDKILTPDEVEVETREAPKRRARATRSALGPAETNVVARAPPMRPVRKNVRAGRRTQAAAAETAQEGDESLLA